MSTADVLAAVRAATAVRDLPPTITTDELLAASGDYSDQWSIEGCEPPLEVSRLDDIGPCILGDTTSDRTMALIGDSAASMWHSALDLVGKRHGWRVLALTKSNCGPAALTYYQWQLKRPYTECDDWQDWRMETIARENAEIVVMAGWQTAATRDQDGTRRRRCGATAWSPRSTTCRRARGHFCSAVSRVRHRVRRSAWRPTPPTSPGAPNRPATPSRSRRGGRLPRSSPDRLSSTSTPGSALRRAPR
ncbi:putative acyltransferase [Gordonia terrae C-6]|uniref:Putative acyltransferase n=1 Tax=Gordonia terrae C-6 TaxID=1316928 RepID=R7YEU0_9ACTN|nr:putative acyltransferase [Gordonia terrae C-6]